MSPLGRKLPPRFQGSRGSIRPKADVSDVVVECLKTAAKRTFGLGRYTVAEGQRKSLEQAGDECGPQVARRGTRHWIRGVGLVGTGCERRSVRRRLRDQGGDLVAQRRAGCEHAVIAMAMYSGRWHQGGDPVELSLPRRSAARRSTPDQCSVILLRTRSAREPFFPPIDLTPRISRQPSRSSHPPGCSWHPAPAWCCRCRNGSGASHPGGTPGSGWNRRSGTCPGHRPSRCAAPRAP